MPNQALSGQERPSLLDTRQRIETPEGIDLILRPAGLVARALAFAIDLALRAAVLGILLLPLARLGEVGVGLGALAYFLVNWGYMVLFEVLAGGRSPGKHMLRLRVIHDDGTPIGWSASMLRNLLRVVDTLPFGYFAGVLCSLQHPQFKRLGDLAAGTWVVYAREYSHAVALPEATPINPPIVLEREEQRAIMAFAERHDQLSSSRRIELAAILAKPLQLAPEQGVAQLNGIARALRGPA